MITPYDWQEGIGNRASYIEGKLTQGAPVVGVSLDAGILFLTFRRQGKKIYEIYDRLIFGGLGQQSDVEALRVAGLEFCSKEGFQRSEADVTIQRVAVGLSGPMKRAFGDFGGAPIVARVLLAEIGASPAEDLYFALDYDGDYVSSRKAGLIAGASSIAEALLPKLKEVDPALIAGAALDAVSHIWLHTVFAEDENPGDLICEAMILERNTRLENRFVDLTPEQL